MKLDIKCINEPTALELSEPIDAQFEKFLDSLSKYSKHPTPFPMDGKIQRFEDPTLEFQGNFSGE